MLNCLDPDQDRRTVGPDLGPNYLHRSSADDKSRRKTVMLNVRMRNVHMPTGLWPVSKDCTPKYTSPLYPNLNSTLSV